MYIPINFLGTKISGNTLTTVDYLIVAGGGGGGQQGGGGGAGGLISGSINAINFTNGEFTASVVVGDGGVGTTGSAGSITGSKNGNNSYIEFGTSSVIAIGGGGGGTNSGSLYDGSLGGSGGGAVTANTSSNGCVGFPGAGTSGQGNDGGFAYVTLSNSIGGGGGGGASQVGQCGNDDQIAGNGGSGSLWFDGDYYAGGGGGVTTTSLLSAGVGGIGGGGNGNSAGSGYTGSRATGGGGGAGFNRPGGQGGSGIVIFRYYGTEIRGYGGDIETIGNYTYHKFRDVATSSFEFSAYSQIPPQPLDYCNGMKFQAGPDGGIASYRLCNATGSVTQSLSGSEYILKCIDTTYDYSITGIGSDIYFMDGCGEYECDYVTFTAGGSGGTATYTRCGSDLIESKSLSSGQVFSTCLERGANKSITGTGSTISVSGSCFFN